MIVIYTKEVTNRVKYIFSYVFEYLLGKEIAFNNDHQKEPVELTISYGIEEKNTDLFFPSINILFENDIKNQNIIVEDWEGLPIFFKTNQPGQILPFDLFSAAFYLISRYEEYLDFEPDEHGRFSSSSSLAYKNNFLERPLINDYAEKIKEIISSYNSTILFQIKHQFINLPTFDIDVPFEFKGRGIKTLPLLVKDFLKLDFKRVIQRILVLINKEKDPYDSLFEIINLLKLKDKEAIVFFLLENKGKYNSSVSYKKRDFQTLVLKTTLEENIKVGIHPSYDASNNSDQIIKEKKRLEFLINQKVYKSRFHFLKINFPESYRYLIKSKVEEDYSMAYPEKSGFRASVCHPFYWFDLVKNEKTSLHVYPFFFMDATYKYYQNISIEKIFIELNTMKKLVNKHNGVFITNFHNDSFSQLQQENINWKRILEEVIN